jgi:hypothetical protein
MAILVLKQLRVPLDRKTDMQVGTEKEINKIV